MFTDYNGLITPPQYQGMYAHNLDSNYTITRPQNEPILLSILNFEVQEPVNGTCLDYLQVNTNIHLWFKKINKSGIINICSLWNVLQKVFSFVLLTYM